MKLKGRLAEVHLLTNLKSKLPIFIYNSLTLIREYSNLAMETFKIKYFLSSDNPSNFENNQFNHLFV
ncbi:hypothetical protein D8M04_04380 [Oceanobacillus piezotolerans]|uniref:Uncharacterized protein n=1 Tax=Oceanobacillus piezotolerans TaxID=2448030 RepID=A0A498DN67_9BACI|nr:hypothetical protein D8M04_04380 [Oceanobacillus piezotolerans]